MLKIITEPQFRLVPWKNGKGQTTELACSPAPMDGFDWRISIADMSADGQFSHFEGYRRHLLLHTGKGLTLIHRQRQQIVQQDKLDKALDMATFDGGFDTYGSLAQGPVKNFNIMVKTAKYESRVTTYLQPTTVILPQADVVLVYCLDGQLSVNQTNTNLVAGQLLQLDNHRPQLSICGQQFIVISLVNI